MLFCVIDFEVSDLFCLSLQPVWAEQLFWFPFYFLRNIEKWAIGLVRNKNCISFKVVFFCRHTVFFKFLNLVAYGEQSLSGSQQSTHWNTLHFFLLPIFFTETLKTVCKKQML